MHMKYTAINELKEFQFHDAQIIEMKRMEHNMIWNVSSINALTTNTQNDYPKDMCVKDAVMVFEDPYIEKLEFGAYKLYDSNHKLIESSQAVVAKPEEYDEILTGSTSCYCFLFGMDDLQNIGERYRACFDIDGGAGHFSLTFTFSKSIVSWDEYDGAAWYEHPKWKKK